MNLPFKIAYGLTGPVLNTFNSLKSTLERYTSWPNTVVADVASLPNPALYANRIVIVRDIDGVGTSGLAFALDGSWYDASGGAL